MLQSSQGLRSRCWPWRCGFTAGIKSGGRQLFLKRCISLSAPVNHLDLIVHWYSQRLSLLQAQISAITTRSKMSSALSNMSTIYDGRPNLAQCQHLDAVVAGDQLCKGYSIAAVGYCPRTVSYSWEVQLRNASSRISIREFAFHFDTMKPWMKRLEIPIAGDGLVVFWEDIWISAKRVVPAEVLEFWDDAFDHLDVEQCVIRARRIDTDADRAHRSEITIETGILAFAESVMRVQNRSNGQ